MDPIEIIAEFYQPGTRTYNILVQHGKQVADKAVSASKNVPHLNPDLKFIREAAMLHDIGIFLTHTPELGCTGEYPYVCHGYLGREILERKGLPEHGLVCERHVGVGITAEEIKRHNLPLPEYDMVPISIEEQVICFADKFFSKNGHLIVNEESVEDILCRLERYGSNKVMIFQSWVRLFK
ncbi:MAG: phosphohydrolase [Desulfobacteraceae bacterium 4572_187]|nr:MAG: phosphohydrolase [Desulfobacteraceae bacterium 4572_187]